MRHQSTWLRQWFGKAGLADEVFGLLKVYFNQESRAERKAARTEKEPVKVRVKAVVAQLVTLFVRVGKTVKKGFFKLISGIASFGKRASKVFSKLPSGFRKLPALGKKLLRLLPNLAVHGFEQLQTWWYRLRVRLRTHWPELKPLLREKGLRALILLVIAGVSLTLTVIFTFGYRVIVDGEEIGYIHAPEEWTSMQDSVRRDFENLEMNQDVKLSLTFVPQATLSSPKALRQAFLETYDVTVDGAAILVAGETRAVLPTEKEAYEVLKTLQEKYTEEGAKVTFDQPVEVRLTSAPLSMAVGVDSAIEILEGRNVTGDSIYTVKEGDTFWSIASAFGMDVDTLMAINGSKNERIAIGDTLTVKVPVPCLSVRATRTVTYEEDIPFTTRQVEDSNMYRGRSAVVTAGVVGKKEVEATIVKINGIEVSRTILSETTLSEPVEKVVKVGTKTPPRTMATGSFIRPCSGYLTSRYGYRWGRNHNGIDVGASTGTPIYAADGGVITMSGWNGGYGKVIVINHENGYVTYYAHCSRLLYSSGKRVAKGDVIAYVGNTGNSTGPHLHFEVRVNGSPRNPLNYVSY